MRDDHPTPLWDQPPCPGRQPLTEPPREPAPDVTPPWRTLKALMVANIVVSSAVLVSVLPGVLSAGARAAAASGPVDARPRVSAVATRTPPSLVRDSPAPRAMSDGPVGPSTEEATTMPACEGGVATLTIDSRDAAAGHRYEVVRLFNCDATPRRLVRTLDISMTTGRGTTRQIVSARNLDEAFVVPPHGFAYAVFTYTGGGSADDPAGWATTIDYRAPDLGKGTLRVTRPTDLADDSTVGVSGWAPSADEAYRLPTR